MRVSRYGGAMLGPGASERQLLEPSANARFDAAREKGKCEGRAHTYRKQKQMKKKKKKQT